MAGQWERLYFEEIDGQRRGVTLGATEAPKGHVRSEPAFGLGRETRFKRREEPGSSIPALHITGTKRMPLEVKFHLRDSLTGNQGGAQAKVQLIDSVQAAARLLRISWGNFIRIGIISSFEPKAEGQGEFQCDLKFEIFSGGETIGRNISKPLRVFGAITDIKSGIDLEQTRLKLGINQIFPNVGTALETLFSALTSPLNSLLRIGEDVETGIGDVVGSLRQVATMAKALLTRLQALMSYVGSVVDPTQDPDNRAAWARARQDALENLRLILVKTYQLGVAAEEKAQGTTTGRVYLVKAGDTLEAIAAAFGTTYEKLLALNPSLTGGPVISGIKIKIP